LEEAGKTKEPEVIDDGNAPRTKQRLADEVREKKYFLSRGRDEVQGKRQPQGEASQPGIDQAREWPAAEVERPGQASSQAGQILLLRTPPRLEKESVRKDLDREMTGKRAIGSEKLPGIIPHPAERRIQGARFDDEVSVAPGHGSNSGLISSR
jgi:hypothetical protein